MKIFLSGIEAGVEFEELHSRIAQYKWMLCSYYYLRQDRFEKILDKSEQMLIDSGAHSFQKGKKVDWIEYTKQYAAWIKANDNSKMLGYFEMDVDNIIGYDRVIELRKILESVSSKIIPVWHKNRGIDEYKKMCEKHSGKIIAITGFKNEDIKDHQYMMFLKYAKEHNCKVHCLGMTRKAILDTIPFDFVDSSSWKQKALFGRLGNNKVSKEYSKENRAIVLAENLIEAKRMQEYYYKKWQSVCKD